MSSKDRDILIRHATKGDMQTVAEMIFELAACHNSIETAKNTGRDLQIDGFETETPAFQCLVAEVKKENHISLVGYALYYPIYSSWQGRSLLLEDLFVKAYERHQGIGNSLFDAVVKELADYHKATVKPQQTCRDLQRDGFERELPAFQCVVAEVTTDGIGSIVGYALYFPIYSSWQGRSLMLQELFVKENERHRGIGNYLFGFVAKEAYSTGCNRIDFHVAGWNRAKSFYERKGAVNLTAGLGRCYWRLSGAALRAEAEGLSEHSGHSP